jgi:hypothetical protein
LGRKRSKDREDKERPQTGEAAERAGVGAEAAASELAASGRGWRAEKLCKSNATEACGLKTINHHMLCIKI